MTKKDIFVEVNCPVCGADDPTKLFWTKDYQFNISEQKFSLQRCGACGAGYLSPRPLEQDMGDYYPESFYWALEGEEVEKSASSLLDRRSKQLAAKYDVIKHLKPGSILDIGTQKGEFIYYMQTKGWSVTGVEFSETPVNLFEVPIQYGEFLALDFDCRYDCVTMWAVLEHVYQPSQYIKKISSLTKPGGTFTGLVTNLNSIQSRYYQKDDYPRHLTIFTKRSLKKLLENNGFHSVEIWTDQKIFGGTLKGGLTFLTKRLLGYTREELMQEWHDQKDSSLFAGKIRGRKSLLLRIINKFDNILLGLLELLLDRLGFGQLLIWRAIKGPENE